MDDASPKPLITTIIPTYRRPNLLRRAIRSVLNQTYSRFQVRIYDNASGDETAAVAAELAKTDRRVQYQAHSVNIGMVANFRYGMERVDTPFFSFLSDDDVLLPDFYQTALTGFETYPEAIGSVTSVVTVNNQGLVLSGPVGAWKASLYQPPHGMLAKLDFWSCHWCATLIRREAVEKVGLLDEEVGTAFDSDFELRMAARFPIVVSPQPGALFVGHGNSCSQNPAFELTWPGWLKMIRNLVDDERIPSEARLYAARVLTDRLKEILFRDHGLRAVLRKRWVDAEKAAEVLDTELHSRFQALALRVLAKVARGFPPFHLALTLCRSLYKVEWKMANRNLQHEWGVYTKLLDL